MEPSGICKRCQVSSVSPGKKWCSPCFHKHQVYQITEFITDATDIRRSSIGNSLANIPSSLRHEVWKKYISYNNRYGKCFCCRTTVIEDSNFECGHIISNSNGGPIILKNLRPVCGQCNKSMGAMNMDEFIVLSGFWLYIITDRLVDMTEEDAILITNMFNIKSQPVMGLICIRENTEIKSAKIIKQRGRNSGKLKDKNHYTKTELVTMARDKSIAGYSKMNKDELYQALGQDK